MRLARPAWLPPRRFVRSGLLLAGLAWLGPSSRNLWSVATDSPSFFIPYESSLRAFRATDLNTGSGDWWFYGRDRVRFYANFDAMPDAPLDGVSEGYFSIRRRDAPPGFDPHDLRTWGEAARFTPFDPRRFARMNRRPDLSAPP